MISRIRSRKALGVTAAFVLMAGLALQQASAQSGYLAGHEVDFRTVLGPPPAPDSAWDKSDAQLVEALQSVDEARQKTAKLDEDALYSRFAGAFGRPIDRGSTPALVALLGRAIVDAQATASAAKNHYRRPRPFQRFQLQHLCSKPNAPKPQERPMEGSSYPSGHSTRGWTVALLLARVAPDRAEALMKRAEEYEESRLICGMHFPTDVQAGQVVAEAVVGRLEASTDFQADLARARKEYESDKSG